jgi:hypothetical protein
VAGDSSAGPLAEFNNLRQEILERIRTMNQLLSLQLTTTGTLFGFALSDTGTIGLLLIVPFSSYLICGRLAAQHFSMLQVAAYIKDDLSLRVPGGLGWEEWLARHQQRRRHPLGMELPLLISFVAGSVLALGWTVAFVLAGDLALLERLVLVASWLAGLASAGLSATLLLQMSGRVSARSWEDVTPS